MYSLQTVRTDKDQFFASHLQSPLSPDQKLDFNGLEYFPENPDLRLKVVVEPFSHQESIQMLTSTGDLQTYTRFGRFTFNVEDQQAELTVYFNEHGYFLPFADVLAGSETYPAGRYLEPQPVSDGKFLIDFNLAYNPYCAYNAQWSCPFPPAENRLMVPIQAGEKIFQKQNHEQPQANSLA